jgi:hypothetical protein
VAGRRRMVAWLASVALMATSLVGLAAAPAQAAVFVTPTRIMPLGDSITWGTGGDGGGGYRPPLVQTMVVGRYSSDMVGSQRSGPRTCTTETTRAIGATASTRSPILRRASS